MPNVQDQQGQGRARVRRRLPVRRRRRDLDARSTASTRGRCTSARSASTRPTRSSSTCSASRCTARRTAARRSRPTAATASTPTTTRCGSIPRDGRHMIVGTDGGFYATWDRTRNWEHLNHLALGQFYHVAIDARHPYRVYGGLQDNGSWGGPTRALGGPGILNEDWISVGGGDGFVCRIDPFDPDIVYSESQDGAMGRRNLRTGERAPHRARARSAASATASTGTRRSSSRATTPGIFYCGGNFVFRSLKRGDDLKADLARDLAHGPRHRDGARRVAAERRRALVRHRRRQPLGHEGRRHELDERRGQGRPPGPALGRDDRAVAVRRGPLLRRVRRPSQRRRRALRLRHRGLRRDLEVDPRQPAVAARRAACART